MIYTAGHSTHEPAAFLRLVEPADTVIDIRSHRSSKWPWFAGDAFEAFVTDGGKRYEWEPGLGGWDVRHATVPETFDRMVANGVDLRAYARGFFPKQRIARQVAPVDGPAWTNRGLLDYAWYTTLPEFQEAARRLARRADDVVIICAEALWWKCHRSMVADYLLAVHGVQAVHLFPGGRTQAHQIMRRIERYPAAVKAEWPW